MPAVLFEYKRKVLPNELGTRHTPLPRGPRKEPVVLGVECNRGRLLPG